MLSCEKCRKIEPNFINLSKKKVDSFGIDDIVKEKARALQNKFNLSSDEVKKIMNVLTCISENIISNYIKTKKEQLK